MVDQKLVSFVKKMLKDGISLNTIKTQLKEKGWPESEVNDAIQSAIPSETPAPKRYCWKCGTENDATAKACKNCGVNLEEVPEEKEKKLKKWLETILNWCSGLFFFLLVLLKLFILIVWGNFSVLGGYKYVLSIILEICLGIFLLPPTKVYLRTKFNIKILFGLKVLQVLILIIYLILLFLLLKQFKLFQPFKELLEIFLISVMP